MAVRLLPADFSSDRHSLINEARGLSELSHPNVTALFDLGEHEGRVYLVFEFQKGQSLRAEAAGRPMNVRRAVEIGIQIADAVADAHAHGFGHAGLSPDSVVISAKGRAKIPAFGLAAQSGFDQDGRLIDYEAPEEARGEAPDDRSDVYSISAIVYETLTNRRPLHHGVSAPSASNPKVPKEVDEVVLKGLAPNPDERFQSAGAFVCALRGLIAVLDALDVAGDEEEEKHLASTQSTSGARVVTIAVLLLIAAAVLFWWFLKP